MTDAPQEPDAENTETLIDDATMRQALEGILMVADEPLPALTLAQVVGRTVGDVDDCLRGLADEYVRTRRGFELRELGGGWRYWSHPDVADFVTGFVRDGQQARLTQAALETLAVVAYRQPVSRGRVSAIRGVNVDGVMRTLLTRGLVEEAGTDAETQAVLYRTTSLFLEKLGLRDIEELPELAPYLPELTEVDEPVPAGLSQAAPAETAGPDPAQPDVARAEGPDAVPVDTGEADARA